VVYLIGAVVTPVAGRAIDRIGHRFTLVALSSEVWAAFVSPGAASPRRAAGSGADFEPASSSPNPPLPAMSVDWPKARAAPPSGYT